MRDAIFILLVSGIGLIALFRTVWGVFAFVGLGILNLQTYTWGIGRTFPFALIVAICTMVGSIFSNERWKIPRQREFWMLVVLWVCFGLTTISAVIPNRGAPSDSALSFFIYISKIFLMVLFSILVIKTVEQIHWLMRIISLSIGFYSIKGGAFSLLSGFSDIVFGPERSFLYANNAIGLAMAMNVPFLFYLIKIEENIWLRRIMWGMLAFSFPAILGTFSRGAWLGLAGVTLMIIFRSKYKFYLLPVGAMVVFIGLPLISSDLVPERVAQRFDQLIHYEEEGSAQSRFWSWEACLRVGLANPILGEGFNFYSPEIYVKYFPEFIGKYGEDKVWTCHNMWLTILAEHGILIFILWVLVLVFNLIGTSKISNINKPSSNLIKLHYIARMLEVSLIAYVICGTFLDTAYFDLYYQLVAVGIMVKAQKQKMLHRPTAEIQKAILGREVLEPPNPIEIR